MCVVEEVVVVILYIVRACTKLTQREREREIHRGVSVVAVVWRSNRVGGHCFRQSPCISSSHIVIMFGLYALSWFYLVRVSTLIFGVISLCTCINRILVFCFFHLPYFFYHVLLAYCLSCCCTIIRR